MIEKRQVPVGHTTFCHAALDTGLQRTLAIMTMATNSMTPQARRPNPIAVLLLTVLLASCVSARPPDETALTRIAFGSCIDQSEPQTITRAIQAYGPDLFVFLGDNVYGDVEGGTADKLREAYERQDRSAEFARLLQAPRILATWDDHDYGVNDGGGDFALKRDAEALFLDFWQVPTDDPRRAREGIYGSFSFGPDGKRVQVILLDTRYFRSPLRPTDEPNAKGKERFIPDPSPDKTMLGAAQWRWLEETLREAADLRIIGSSIQVIAEAHGFERWGLLPAERDRLYRLLAQSGDTPTFVISGDRHLAALYHVLGPEQSLWEVTSSSLNLALFDVDEMGPHQLDPPYVHENFGTIEIDWQAHRAVLAIRDINGKTVRQQTLVFGR